MDTNEKAIKKIRFKPFDYSKAGVYGSDEWRKRAGESLNIHQEFLQATEL